MHRKSKTIIIFSLTLILFLSICYAVLTSSLSVNGIFSFRENVWDVHFENVLLNQKSISKELPVIGADRLSVSFNASLNKPFDIYEFSIDVVNNSSLDAAIQSIDVTGLSDNVLNYIEYSITYNNGTNLAVNNKLFSKAVSPINIKFKYKDITVENLSASDINISPTISINYKQDDGTAVAVANSNEWRFAYTGAEQEFTVPVNSTYKVELWGASGNNQWVGGNQPNFVKENPAYGGYTAGTIGLNSSDTYYLYVGGTNQLFNCNTKLSQGPGSGGATDVRLTNGEWNNFNSLKSRIMVAGGAGGSYIDSSATMGGHSGGLVSYSTSHHIHPVSSAGQTYGGIVVHHGSNGGFGFGGITDDGDSPYYNGGAGGYYGGGAGPAGGGGSSFISGHNGCVAIKEESTADNIIQVDDSTGTACTDGTTDITCSYHYSGKKFTNTVMIDGKGYKWTTTKGSEVVGMPTHNGKSTMIGNDGEGYAKITYIG